jgi:1,4-dihydroxy-2-naphthoyl-CoA hydrolase
VTDDTRQAPETDRSAATQGDPPVMPSGAAGGGLVELLGLRTVEATGDRVVLELDVDSRHHQPYGIVHGGVHCAVVETAASVAGAIWLGEEGKVVGVSNQTDFLRAVTSGTLRATATPLHRGRLQQLWQVEVRDADERLVVRGQVRLQNLRAEHFAP